jgi:hypothetical protein
MFTIYSPDEKRYLHAVSFQGDEPQLEWGDGIDEKGLIATKEDAILMAKEVQRIRVAEEIFHFCVQVLELEANKLPNFKLPVYELGKPEK